MSKTLKVVKASIGTYTDKDGKTKNRYRVIGSVIQTRAGEMLVLDLMPFSGWDGRAFLNDPEQREQQGGSNFPDDDIPY